MRITSNIRNFKSTVQIQYLESEQFCIDHLAWSDAFASRLLIFFSDSEILRFLKVVQGQNELRYRLDRSNDTTLIVRFKDVDNRDVLVGLLLALVQNKG